MASSGIIVCGKRYSVDHKVVTYDDPGGFSAYVPHRTDDITKVYAVNPPAALRNRVSRYRKRTTLYGSRSLSRLKQVVRQIVVHLDGCRDAKMCFNVLHNQRGLSVHFMVDNDGTIYQTLDLEHCAFHAGGVNEVSVGIELQNRGDAARSPNYYKTKRPTVTCRVHGAQFLAYDFTPEQYQAMQALTRTLTQVFDIPMAVPNDTAKRHVWTTIDAPRRFGGFLGHYHISRNKWDPGPFDFKRVFRSVGSAVMFPLSAPRKKARRDDKRESLASIKSRAGRYHDNAEKDARAHFPLGPLGRSRLWHGGVHLTAPATTQVRAALRGQIVAARMGPPCGVGSCNFVLLKHRLTIGRASLAFFSLYYHLAWATESQKYAAAVPWLAQSTKAAWRKTLDSGSVALLGHAVEAGDVLGSVGDAGPPGYREPQIHLAIFSADELTSRIDPGTWTVLDGTGSRLCRDMKLLRRIDRPVGGQPPDGALSRREIRNFFSLNPAREGLRRTVLRYKTEWTPGGWDELNKAKDFAKLPPSRRRRLYLQQIKPTLWWTTAVARHAGLPNNGVVYAYHPIGFLTWFAEIARKKENLRQFGIESAARWEGKAAPKHLTVDVDSADDMTDREDEFSGERSKKLTLEDLVAGYPDGGGRR